MKLYIEGFRGPWGWVAHFENYMVNRNQHEEIKVTQNVEEADVIFQCDPANWQRNAKWLGKKFVIANVLDFADWHDGTPSDEVESYVDGFCRQADKVTAISNDVIGKLLDRGINASMFFYPSQVDDSIIKSVVNIPKQNRFISFCRLGDPGKRIELAVNSFADSGLANRGWQYFLIGPEHPRFVWQNIPGVKVFPYMDKGTLYSLVASSMATIMPSDGEGLGLPAIESLLVGTVPITRKIKPMVDVLVNLPIYFETDEDLTAAMLEVEYQLKNGILPIANIQEKELVRPWERELAFLELSSNLTRWYYEK